MNRGEGASFWLTDWGDVVHSGWEAWRSGISPCLWQWECETAYSHLGRAGSWKSALPSGHLPFPLFIQSRPPAHWMVSPTFTKPAWKLKGVSQHCLKYFLIQSRSQSLPFIVTNGMLTRQVGDSNGSIGSHAQTLLTSSQVNEKFLLERNLKKKS